MVAGLFCLNKAAREKHKHISLFFCFFFHSIFFFKTSRLLATRPDVFLVAQNLLFFMHFWQERMLVAPPPRSICGPVGSINNGLCIPISCLIFSWCYVFDVWTLTAHAVLKLLFKFFFSTWVFNKKFSCQSLLDKGGHLPICLSSFPLTFPDRKGPPGEGVTPEGGDMQFA